MPPPANPFAEGSTGQASPYASPHAGGQPHPGHAAEGDATGGVIPYKNPQALTAYYLGILGMLPLIGIVFSLPAFVLGIRGLQARKRNPVVKGSAHAWIGIILGGLFSLLWGVCGGGIILSLLSEL